MSAMKRYIITIDPYDGHEVIAETASKARWKAVSAFREAFGNRHMTVAEILRRMTTLHLGPAAPDQIAAIVRGKL